MELKQLEEDPTKIYEDEGGGLLTQESKYIPVRLEGRRNALLLEKEETQRLKGRATWLEVGDDNTKFLHAYAKGRKASNTIWGLDNLQGESHFKPFGKDALVGQGLDFLTSMTCNFLPSL